MAMDHDTGALIHRLAESAEPVQPLPRPWVRTSAWVALAIAYLGLVIFVVSPRSDLMAKLSEWRYVIEQLAALATGVAAALAAFASVIPGYSRKFILAPALPLAVWLATLGQGCVQDWISSGPHGLTLRPDWLCFPSIALVGALPAVAMLAMLRRGAPLTPRLTIALGALAAAGLGNFGLRFFHPQDAGLMVLVWQFGSVFALSALAGWAGRYMLPWRAILDSERHFSR